ncbi:MAG: Zn-ribbon domain-containing OB-fold protein [Streptosporangiaceae bacterium]
MVLGAVRADPRSAPFFEAAARDTLLIKRCGGCERWLGPEATGCAGCGESAVRWEAACGRGILVSFAGAPGLAGEGGGVLALVELEEGPWVHTRLVAGPADAVVGMAVVARFEHPAEGESYPLFRPSAG